MHHKSRFAMGASLIAFALATPVSAQQQPAEEPTNLDSEVSTPTADNSTSDNAVAERNEIIVTAQFREQALQDTPIAITAVNAEMLQARSQTNISEVTAQAPNVTLRPQGAAFGPSLGASIRGVGQFDFNPALEPGVGLYVDDVYYATLTGAIFDLLDLERVEVLRGPQGTLFGRNTSAGALNITTNRPDLNEFGGFANASYGNFDEISVQGDRKSVV